MEQGAGRRPEWIYVHEESNQLMSVMVGRSRALADAAARAHDSI
jgi:hypothetical protein